MKTSTRPWCAFVHTDKRQQLAARVAAYALKRFGGGNEHFDVRILTVDGTVLDERNDGRPIANRSGSTWDHTDPTAFQFLRRSVPEEMSYRGRAALLDPDAFAIKSLVPLFESDMQGAAVLARYIDTGFLGQGKPYFATSVMLMDCAKLTHWSMASELEGYFTGRFGYFDLLQLRTEPAGTTGVLDEKWNSLDKLTTETRILHFTRPSTQPWLAGLAMDGRIFDPTQPIVEPTGSLQRGGESSGRYYLENPDQEQVGTFFRLLGESILDGAIDPVWIEMEITAGRVRPDLFDALEKFDHRRLPHGVPAH